MRLNKPVGLYIDRDKPISFRFDGCDYTGFYGDTIASALAANGVRVLSRSFKYHRPRGIFTMTGEDANTLVQVGEEPNVRADTRLIEDGLVVTPQNVFGSLTFDFASCIGWFSRFLPVGFYYKAFYKPKGIWKVWEPIIRRMAGLGKVDMQAQPQATDKVYRFADVAVIGAGPAGMNAALEAATNGAEVLLIEENPLLGGSLNYARFGTDRSVEDQVRTRLINEVEKYPNIHVLTNAQCTGWFADNWLAIVCAQRLIKLRAKVVVAATGSLEQPAVFRNND
jgi:sarcosine oxidase subunit alpha